MKPHDCFGVIVRVFGLLSFLIGLIWICTETLSALQYGGARYPGTAPYGVLFDFFYPVIFLLVGYLLMRGADWITNRLYPLGKP